MTMMLRECPTAPEGDRTATILSSLLIVGLVLSYLPQHARIILTKTSEGFSNGFLFLGATSGASSLLNVLTLQREEILCCPQWGPRPCLESTLGVIQLVLQWACFNLILVLFVLYFPAHKRYHDVDYVLANVPAVPDRRQISIRQGEWDQRRMARTWIATLREQTDEYWYAHLVAYAVLIHFLCFGLLTALIVDPSASLAPHAQRIRGHWATFLGILASFLAAFQYLPQIRLTWRAKTVGSLSIPMMLIQSPGSFVFVYSLAIRPHVNWTTWVVFAITGVLQACLLIMCIAWKRRQRHLGIDDYGNALRISPASSEDSMTITADDRSTRSESAASTRSGLGERAPLLAR